MPSIDKPNLVPGRSCGTCTLCCKVLKISWFTPEKQGGVWCAHCTPGKGCHIWEQRPQGCIDYHCLWRSNADLEDVWRPDIAGFLISEESETLPFSVIVDPGKPNSWRREPYYSGLKRAAQNAIEKKRALVVQVAARQWIMLPDGDIPVPIGLENTDFHLSRGRDGHWAVSFSGADGKQNSI